ncbi:hypothetical protein LC653_28885 [Nostoc sp. CHAB 5784]|uniref:hypothetical protein n=1 Tax=Nostoc mirabile TaxID=2907820 RepID=UPI001E3B35C7|nr:hypothetical protein [Nostoc mirabile]MCC5667786.1 hypothetical protein [Nostoc mirabile CHAB5784]
MKKPDSIGYGLHKRSLLSLLPCYPVARKVSFYLKGLGIEYQFQKGTCQLPSNQPQK